jgi:hypothetical protein
MRSAIDLYSGAKVANRNARAFGWETILCRPVPNPSVTFATFASRYTPTRPDMRALSHRNSRMDVARDTAMDVARDTATVARVGRAPMLLLFIPCFHEPSKWCREYTPPSGSIIICDNEIKRGRAVRAVGNEAVHRICTARAEPESGASQKRIDNMRLPASPSELLASPSEALSVTQRALRVTQRALSVTQRALNVTQRALSVTQRALSVTQRALSVTQRALSVTQRAPSVTQRGS